MTCIFLLQIRMPTLPTMPLSGSNLSDCKQFPLEPQRHLLYCVKLVQLPFNDGYYEALTVISDDHNIKF